MLELAIARALYDDYPDFSEGRLAKIRSHVVSRASCAVVAKELDLGTRLLERGRDLIPEEELQRLMKNRNVLAALLEASLAALFLEHGFQKIEPAVVDAFAGRIEYALTSHVDFKTELQEALARRGKSVSYSVLNAEARRTTARSLVRQTSTATRPGSAKDAPRRRRSRRPRSRCSPSSASPSARRRSA